jgi:hypothetical protein
MKKICACILSLLVTATALRAQSSAPDPETLPASIRPELKVHFVSIDSAFTAPNTNWTPCLSILTGGDQVTQPVTIGGHSGVQVMGIKFNTADDQYPIWASHHSIDILMQIYGDDALVNEKGEPRYFNFLTGTLPEPIAVDGGALPASLVDHKWHWVLFRIPNGLRHMDGGRLVGTIHPKARADANIAGVSRRSGQNGGTIRMDGLHNLKVRFVAFGEKGAFGEPDQVNVFAK